MTMITHDYKIRLIQFCIETLEGKAAELQSEIDDAMKAANDYGAPKDRYDGFKNQQMRKVEMLSAQMHLVQEDVRFYLQVDRHTVCDTVKQGALVATNDQLLLIATSMGKVEFEGQTPFVISPKVPFYEAIKGAKKGDAVKFRDKTITLLEIV